jgi:hypothetical protein
MGMEFLGRGRKGVGSDVLFGQCRGMYNNTMPDLSYCVSHSILEARRDETTNEMYDYAT